MVCDPTPAVEGVNTPVVALTPGPDHVPPVGVAVNVTGSFPIQNGPAGVITGAHDTVIDNADGGVYNTSRHGAIKSTIPDMYNVVDNVAEPQISFGIV